MQNAVSARLMRTALASLGMLALTVIPAHAGVIFTNGAPDQVSGDNMTQAIQAEDFVLFGTNNVTNIRFWTLQQTSADYSGKVWWAIFDNSAGHPGALLQGGSTTAAAESLTGANSPFAGAEYVINLPVSFQLTAGTYWLALHNGELSDNGFASDMLWGTTKTGFGVSGVYNIDDPLSTSGPWVSTDQEHAFLIEGEAVAPIPEPGTYALLSGGLVLVAVLRRKQFTTSNEKEHA